MLFKIAIFFLLAPAVLAVPSWLGARIARRREGRQSQVINRLDQDAGTTSNTEYSKNWAGAGWAEGYGTFTYVDGTFTVPTPSGASGTSAAAWVGIDGLTCQSAILQTGIDFTVSSDGPTYDAWFEFYPLPAYFFEDFKISAGDVIKLSVTASSPHTGTVTIDNLTKEQTASADLESPAPLCGQNAEWIVEDYLQGGSLVPFADFGTVEFKDATATGPDGTHTYTPSGATIIDLKQNKEVLTSVTTSGSSVTIKYV